MMKKELLAKAREAIQKEMEVKGYIDDSDYTDRFLDRLAKEVVEQEILKGSDDIDLYYEKEAEIEQAKDELSDLIKNEIMIEYNKIGTINDAGDYIGCYYKDIKGAILWANNWREQNIFEAHKEFIETLGGYVNE